jgi:Neuraminidase (sialidase)
MKKSKFFISMFTLLILLTGGPFQSTVNAQAISISNDIRPYYSYVSNINAFISIDNGYATCLGSLSIYYDYPTSITITLQRSENGVNWSNVKAWSNNFDGIGVHSLEKDYYVNSGYVYRVFNVVNVRNGTKIIETASVSSLEIHY